MATGIILQDSQSYDVYSDTTWIELYPPLLSLARYFVTLFKIPCWQGQEGDLAEDIVQETARRLIERSRRTEQGSAAPIRSYKQMMITIACNYCRDMRRRDYRLVRITPDEYSHEASSAMSKVVDVVEVATDNAFRETIFVQLAREVARFPEKQRRALLVDLANLMAFDSAPTSLQRAFLEVGIRLQDYKGLLPEKSINKSRHAALVSLAYKRIASLFCWKYYDCI